MIKVTRCQREQGSLKSIEIMKMVIHLHYNIATVIKRLEYDLQKSLI